jgi:hypothetical protein
MICQPLLPTRNKKLLLVLSGENYAEWSITAAFLVNGGEQEYYKVELTKGEEKQLVKLNKEGQAV